MGAGAAPKAAGANNPIGAPPAARITSSLLAPINKNRHFEKKAPRGQNTWASRKTINYCLHLNPIFSQSISLTFCGPITTAVKI